MRFRRHLQKGKNFNKWELKMDNETVYFPLDSSILLHNCTLKNKMGIAKKIHDGKNKSVCAWIDCNGFDYNCSKLMYSMYTNVVELFYNPRLYPFWTDKHISILDGMKFEYIYIQNKSMVGVNNVIIHSNGN